MVSSINTNPAALAALQVLNATGREADEVQFRITTGLKVGRPSDNDAIYSISQNMRGEVSGLDAVATGLNATVSVIDVAIAAGTSISDLMLEMKEKAVAALDRSLDTASRTALQSDFAALRDQIDNIVVNAEFGGTNLIGASATDITVVANPDGDVFTVSAQLMTVTTLNIQTISLNSTTNATIALAAIEAATNEVNQKLARLGTRGKSLDIHSLFVGKLSDGMEIGIGNLVDADLAVESARSQALSVKAQLGIQSLAIANDGPSRLLALFR